MRNNAVKHFALGTAVLLCISINSLPVCANDSFVGPVNLTEEELHWVNDTSLKGETVKTEDKQFLYKIGRDPFACAVITDYTGTESDIVFRDYADYVRVSRSCADLSERDDISSVTYDGLYHFGEYDDNFRNCKNLETLTVNAQLSERLISLYDLDEDFAKSPSGSCYLTGSFAGCTNLKTVTLPHESEKVSCMIGEGVFEGCTALKELDLSGYWSIYEDAFLNCTALEKIIFNANVKKIGDHALGFITDTDGNYQRCEGLTIYGVPDTAAEIYAKENGIPFVAVASADQANGTDTPESQPDSHGLTLDLSSETLYTGEVCQLLASRDEDCWLDYPVIQSANNDIVLVYNDGHLFAQKAGTTTVRVREQLDPEKVTLAEDDDGIRTVTRTITVTDKTDLSDVQKGALETISRKETELSVVRFPRAKAVIKGFLAADAPRLTLDDITRMIAETDSFEAFFRKLTEQQPYPDYYGGSGFTSVLYCLNSEGTERIRVFLDCGQPPHEIIYDRLDENGCIAETRYLYPESRVHETVDPNPTEKDWFYNVLREITDCIPAPGDANCDGRTDVSDAVLIARFAAEDREAVITEAGKNHADVNGDGSITADDSARILLYIAKKISRAELAAPANR